MFLIKFFEIDSTFYLVFLEAVLYIYSHNINRETGRMRGFKLGMVSKNQTIRDTR